MVIMGASESGQWAAGRWQRERAGDLGEWRSSQGSLALLQLSTLCEAISDTVFRMASSADALGGRLPDVLGRCDELAFSDGDEVAAYMLLHLADRYGRVTQVLERLFTARHLPIRRRSLSVLEVGSGPAPGLYAVHDFYDDLVLWAQTTGQQVEFTSVTQARAIDRGPAWGWLLHRLSEKLQELRRELPGFAGAFPYRVAYPNLTGFSPIREHVRELDHQAQTIANDFDRADEPISRGLARQLAQKEGIGTPSAYDVVIMCNFLTDETATVRFRDEIRSLALDLTPGGLFIVLGSADRKYQEIWGDVRRLLRGTGLQELGGFREPIAANPDPGRAAQIRRQVCGDLGTIQRGGGTLPPRLAALNETSSFPEFQALMWKNQRPRKQGARR